MTDKRESYEGEAYRFLMDALERTREGLKRSGHISGRELLDGIQTLAEERYGPLAALVFERWGIHDGSDFGNMVYELIERGVLFKKDEDRLEDFMGGKTYRRIFEEEYFTPHSQ
jgi:uncharacterized repeat protein (TIGR04138 family)